MICARCSTPNPDGVVRCAHCSWPVDHDSETPLPAPTWGPGGGDEELTLDGSQKPGFLPTRDGSTARYDTPSGSRYTPGGSRTYASLKQAAGGGLTALPDGCELGPRYTVVRAVGRGGMGAVYRVRDHELDRDVALKVIRPEIADDPLTLERFKREISLSSKITHKNVLRVYDLGEVDGLRFVTMQFVEGEDLSHILRREGKLPLPRVLDILRQTARGLMAAHEAGVVHRDLKPQNVMLDSSGTAFLTDFGLAKSLGETSVTEAGMLMGTPHYMSPEQVRTEAVDARSDIYSLGVILYELCTGAQPFAGGSAFEVMMRRLQKQPTPVGEVSPEVPANLRRVIDRCLALDPAARYQSVKDLLWDLDAEERAAAEAAAKRLPRWVLVTGGVLVTLLVALGGWLATRPAGPPPVQEPRSVLIADFQNLTGDPVFDGTLESTLGVALEGASFITSYNRNSARRVAARLQPGATRIDEALARLVAGREGIDVITAGEIRPRGNGYALTIRAIDSRTGKEVASEQANVSGREQVLSAVTRLAAGIRSALGDRTPESAQIAAAETFTAASLEAAHEYAVGMDLQFAGKWDEAIAAYQKALRLDAQLGRAYAGMGVIENNRGRHQEADRYFQQAMAQVGRMSEREKFRTRGAYYLVVTRDADKAIEEYGALVKQFPADNAALANLGVAYQLKRDFDKALEFGSRAIQIYPRNVPQRSNVGLFAMYAGDFERAIREQQASLEVNPEFVQAIKGLALAQFAAGQRDAALETWKKLEAGNPSAAAEGLADIALYDGRLRDAEAILGKAAEADVQAGDADAAARKLLMLSEIARAHRQAPKAVALAERAIQLSGAELIRFGAGDTFAEAGDEKRALAVAAELGKAIAGEPQMYAMLIRGEVERRRGNLREALNHFRDAGGLADSWLVRFARGRAYVEAGAFAEAHAEIEACVSRRGEATDVFLDAVPTYRVSAPVQYYLGRAHEGLKSPEAIAAYNEFLAVRANADAGDPLVADARKRVAAQ